MRADVFLTEVGYAESRQRAKIYIDSGFVLIDGKTVKKASESVDETVEHEVVITDCERYVGRGGYKLEGALEAFNIDVTGKHCIDIGASTGGFTDCLLQKGAASVIAVDSGRDQLHPRLRNDGRVRSLEGVNARYLTPQLVGVDALDIAVMDVSFISQTLIIPQIPQLLGNGGVFISLIKPQFEAGRGALNKNGIVKNTENRYSAALRVVTCALSCGFELIGFDVSPIKGGDGNVEFLAAFRLGRTGQAITDDAINKTIRTKVFR